MILRAALVCLAGRKWGAFIGDNPQISLVSFLLNSSEVLLVDLICRINVGLNWGLIALVVIKNACLNLVYIKGNRELLNQTNLINLENITIEFVV